MQMDFMMAMAYAYSKISNATGYNITILMETGTHYLRSGSIEAYNTRDHENSKIDFAKPAFKLIIKALGCSDTSLELAYQLPHLTPLSMVSPLRIVGIHQALKIIVRFS